MSSSPDFVAYICEQLKGLGDVRSRKMFGEYMVYLNDKPVIIICDDRAMVKVLPCLEELLGENPKEPPYEGAKEHYVLDPDDTETLRRAAQLAEAVTPLPKKKKPKGEQTAPKGGPIPWHIAWSAHSKPEPHEINRWVDNPLFSKLQAWLADTYGVEPAIEYSKCSMDPGWNLKYKKGSKALCTLYPRTGWFTCMVTFGAKLIPELELTLPLCSEKFQILYKKTSFFNGGKWLALDVKEQADLEDVKRLILLKARPPKKKAD